MHKHAHTCTHTYWQSGGREVVRGELLQALRVYKAKVKIVDKSNAKSFYSSGDSEVGEVHPVRYPASPHLLPLRMQRFCRPTFVIAMRSATSPSPSPTFTAKFELMFHVKVYVRVYVCVCVSLCVRVCVLHKLCFNICLTYFVSGRAQKPLKTFSA